MLTTSNPEQLRAHHLHYSSHKPGDAMRAAVILFADADLALVGTTQAVRQPAGSRVAPRCLHS